MLKIAIIIVLPEWKKVMSKKIFPLKKSTLKQKETNNLIRFYSNHTMKQNNKIPDYKRK